MTPIQNLHYAIGEIAYAIATADGKLQKEEQQKFESIVEDEIKNHDPDFDISDIIFKIRAKEKSTVKAAYESAMHQMQFNSHYLSPELKAVFVCVIEKIAKAYPPVTIDERLLIDKFKSDIEPLKGDPVYYNLAKH